ncbi:MAG TPA: CaiB/BaiF CoA-transferase family protein [Polyangiales bacterium]|nr:CaiB/BaiF CoA-transferase family protein [Polyangiales bacterium]
MSAILSGVTVLDISEYIAGPYCGSLLADLGARVIKVEPPDGAEERRLGSRERYRGNTRMALAYNRGKESLAVDLRKPEGRAVLYAWVPKVDIVIQNFVPSAAKKLGIDYDALSAINPRLIFVSSTAFGEVGPYQKRKGFDIIAHAASGVMSNYADEDGAPRGPGAINYMDIATGMFNAMGIMAALYHRERTGVGQKIETSLFSTGLALQAQNIVHIDELDARQHAAELELLRTARGAGKKHTQVIDEFATMRLREDMPNSKRPIEVPDCAHRPTDRQVYPYYRVYPTGDGYLSIAALNRNLREKLCAVLEMNDPHVHIDLGNTSDETYYEQKALMKVIEERLLQHPNAYWIERLEAAGIPCGPVSYRPNLYDDPQVQALDMMWHLPNSELGKYKSPGHPIRFSKSPAAPSSGAPALGEHTDALLREMGHTPEQIAALRASGVVK